MNLLKEIKDQILMPPPKTISSSAYKNENNPEDFRRDLKETPFNSSLNYDLYKSIFKEHKEDIEWRNMQLPDFLKKYNYDEKMPMPKLLVKNFKKSSNSVNLINMNSNNLTMSSGLETLSTSNLTNNISHKYLGDKENLRMSINTNNMSKSCSIASSKNVISIETSNDIIDIMSKKALTSSPEEISSFVSRLKKILSKFNYQEFMLFKIELETRNRDYLNKALNQEYFKDCLLNLQNKILRIIKENIFSSTTEINNKSKENILSSDMNMAKFESNSVDKDPNFLNKKIKFNVENHCTNKQNVSKIEFLSRIILISLK